MRAWLIEELAALYNLLIWGVLPLAAFGVVYCWRGERPARRVRAAAVEGLITVDKAHALANAAERRGLLWGGLAALAAVVLLAFLDANMHEIVRVAHRLRD